MDKKVSHIQTACNCHIIMSPALAEAT